MSAMNGAVITLSDQIMMREEGVRKEECTPADKNTDTRSVFIERILVESRVPTYLTGRAMLADAIMMAINDESTHGYITKVLYPTVALMHATTCGAVERNMRTALKRAWERGGKYLHERFSKCPNNRKYILAAAEDVKEALCSENK